MSRDKVLGDIRAALSVKGEDGARRRAVASRLAEPPAHIVPARARQPARALAELLQHYLEGQGARVLAVADAREVPAAVEDYLRAEVLPLRVRSGDDRYLAGMPWDAVPGLERDHGVARADDLVGVSRALAAVAETGTLVLASGADNPVTLAFLPETHIVVVEAEAIVGSYEEAMARVRAELGASFRPHTLNLVSGPSRTADIGGKLVRGAHGPRRLAVIVVGAVPEDGAATTSGGSSAGSA